MLSGVLAAVYLVLLVAALFALAGAFGYAVRRVFVGGRDR